MELQGQEGAQMVWGNAILYRHGHNIKNDITSNN